MVSRKPEKDCDVAVAGTGIGALLGALILARRGLSVLVLRERGYTPFFEKYGLRFATFSNLSDLDLARPAISRLIKAAGLQGWAIENLRRDPRERRWCPFQVLLPEARIDLFCEKSFFDRELEREFPEERERIKQFYQDLEKTWAALDKQRTSAKGEASAFFPVKKRFLPMRFFIKDRLIDLSVFSREFATFIKMQIMASGNIVADSFHSSLVAYLLADRERHVSATQERIDVTAEEILSRFIQSGGAVEEVEGIEKIVEEPTGGVALYLKGERRTARSRCILFGQPISRLPDWIGNNHKKVFRLRETFKPLYVLYPFFIGIRRRSIPVGMHDVLLSLEDIGRPPDRGNLLFVNLSHLDDRRKQRDGRTALTVESFVLWEEYQKRWCPETEKEHENRVMKHLRRIIPFLDDYIEFVDSKFGHEMIAHWSYPHFYYPPAVGLSWREEFLPLKITSTLYTAGKENFPFLGLEGEVLSGLLVGRRILKALS